MWLENNVASPSISLRQSRCSSHATPNHVINCAPACDKRSHAECRVISLKVPDASVTTKTSNPSSMAESAGNATQTSVTTPAIINCFLPVALTAFTKSSLSQALIFRYPVQGKVNQPGDQQAKRQHHFYQDEHTVWSSSSPFESQWYV